MITKKIILSTILFFFISSFSLEERTRFSKSFKNEINKAIIFIDDKKEEILYICNEYEVDPELFISIIFPELIRYNSFQDKIEVSANKLFYTNWGAEYSDFSIGILQMKPSFVERLSNSKKISNYDDLFIYPEDCSKEEVRSIIVDRLQSVTYQLKYLAYFISLINSSYNIQFKNNYEKIRYYATAYNGGAWYNQNNNNKISKKKTYPYGGNVNKIKQYSYSDISLYYYQDILNK
tara:strand:+ start:1840 stop:2544 length:705 start_codon:yes stop_codon:yes gene_type:complete